MQVQAINNTNTHFKARLVLNTSHNNLISKELLQKYKDFAQITGTNKDEIIISLRENLLFSKRGKYNVYNLSGSIVKPFTCLKKEEYPTAKYSTLTETFMGSVLCSPKLESIKNMIYSSMTDGLKKLPESFIKIMRDDNKEFFNWLNSTVAK